RREHAGAPGRGPRRHEHRARECREVDRETGVLLLLRPEARAGRGARDAGRLSRRARRSVRPLDDLDLVHVLRTSFGGLAGPLLVIIVDAFKAVFWSFFGVRKRADYDSDAEK